MKKIFFIAALAVVGLGATACSSDDDAAAVNPLVGTWKAETLTYTFGGQTNTHPYDHPMFKEGCATDYLTLNENQSASLKENNKNTEDVCVDETANGVWTEDVITLEGMDVRNIESVTNSNLVLVYPLTFMGQTLDITVSYSKQ